MGRKINLIVNYRNNLGIYHLAVEQMVQTDRNIFIKPEDFASFVAERYLQKNCDHVICIEYLSPKITKASLLNLASLDTEFIKDHVKKNLGRSWEFTKENKVGD